jgi:hypothetical protein
MVKGKPPTQLLAKPIVQLFLWFGHHIKHGSRQLNFLGWIILLDNENKTPGRGGSKRCAHFYGYTLPQII